VILCSKAAVAKKCLEYCTERQDTKKKPVSTKVCAPINIHEILAKPAEVGPAPKTAVKDFAVVLLVQIREI
jgi:hypothetical protein